MHCPRAPTLEPSYKQRAPTQKTALPERKGKVVSCRPWASRSSSQWEGCRVGSVWSASSCFACWSLWLAGRGPLSLLVVSLIVAGFFKNVSPFRLKRVWLFDFGSTDPRTGTFLVRYPHAAAKPDGCFTPLILCLNYLCVGGLHLSVASRRSLCCCCGSGTSFFLVHSSDGDSSQRLLCSFQQTRRV